MNAPTVLVPADLLAQLGDLSITSGRGEVSSPVTIDYAREVAEVLMSRDEVYSNILRTAAHRWGVSVPAGVLDDADLPRPQVVETLCFQGKQSWKNARLELVTLNGLWSYTADFQTNNAGGGFGAFLKFCDPFATRAAALEAGIAFLHKRGATQDSAVAAWLAGLAPQQLSLF